LVGLTFARRQSDSANYEGALGLPPSASHQLLECAWYFTALDDATEAKLSAIVRKAAS
jgi:hypothetical protein